MAVTRTYDQILNEVLRILTQKTRITHTQQASVARSILEIFCIQVSGLYEYIDERMKQKTLSTATGSFLNEIGEGMSCLRFPEESDNNYRYRISKQVFVGAGSNMESIRLRCLSVDSVKDVVIVPYSHGVGSFSVHVITDSINTPDHTVSAVQAVLNENVAAGIKAVATKASLVPMDIEVLIVSRNKDKEADLSSVKESIETYLTNSSMGTYLNLYNLKSYVVRMTGISSMEYVSVIINGIEEKNTEEYKIAWDERVVLSACTVRY